MKHHKKLLKQGTVFILLPSLLFGCTITIAQIREDPARFGKREILVVGTVNEVFTIPLTRIAIYLLDDGTGEIPVLTAKAPRKAAKVAIRCKLVYFSGKETVEDTQSKRGTITNFIVDLKILKREAADELAGRLLGILEKLIAQRNVAFFVIEIPEENTF